MSRWSVPTNAAATTVALSEDERADLDGLAARAGVHGGRYTPRHGHSQPLRRRAAEGPAYSESRIGVGGLDDNEGVLKSHLPVFEPIEFEIRLLNARLDRAEQHYESFGQIWGEYLAGLPHSLDHVREEDGTVAVRLRRRTSLPVELSLAFGEFLYELRAALDNCLYAVAVLVSGQNPPPSAARLEWPIRITPRMWQDQVNRYSDLPSEIREALEAIQPYQAQYPEWNSLRILHDLARVDRHRSPHGLGLYLSHLRMSFDQGKIAVVDRGRPGIIHEDGEIVRLRPGPGVVLSPENFGLDLKFDVDVTNVRESLGPSNTVGRPWGPLHTRMSSLIKAVDEYSTGLIAIAVDHVTGADYLRV